MNRIERIVWVVCVVVTLGILFTLIECRAAEPGTAGAIESELACGRRGQELIDIKEYSQAVQVLEDCLRDHPDSDWLWSMLGRAYYKMGDLEKAEAQFRKALEINKNNPVAKRLIVEMRKTQDLLKDRDISEWINIAQERVADLVTLVVGVWLGTLLSGISGRFYSHFVRTNFRKALARRDYDYAADLLEDLHVKREKAQLRMRLRELLHDMGLEESKKMIIEYVDDQDVENKLLRFLEKVEKRMRES
ncbi:tetratricopeptide repeat protein [Maridesulfovibrio sp.]|uniref:tetratricopeptide repeat protein n=1 Tax=Maridesulfovibrio sp. TaxID=2795000 RepID=UPI002A186D6B|nr:tetratricopeptide repeat protein [Maridesulfovibrio sp.]